MNKDKKAGPICGPRQSPPKDDGCETKEAAADEPPPKDPAREMADLLFAHMKKIIDAEIELDNPQFPIVPMWRATKITPIMTVSLNSKSVPS